MTDTDGQHTDAWLQDHVTERDEKKAASAKNEGKEKRFDFSWSPKCLLLLVATRCYSLLLIFQLKWDLGPRQCSPWSTGDCEHQDLWLQSTAADACLEAQFGGSQSCSLRLVGGT